jgi:hypothetical protein
MGSGWLGKLISLFWPNGILDQHHGKILGNKWRYWVVVIMKVFFDAVLQRAYRIEKPYKFMPIRMGKAGKENKAVQGTVIFSCQAGLTGQVAAVRELGPELRAPCLLLCPMPGGSRQTSPYLRAARFGGQQRFVRDRRIAG